MKFNIGDIVRFLNETGGGKITRIEDSGFIYVMSDDGFEIPVRAAELILQSPDPVNPDSRESEYKDIPQADKTLFQDSSVLDFHEIAGNRLPENLPYGTRLKLVLGLVPEDIDAVFKTTINSYFINDSKYFLYYRVGYQQQGKYFHLNSGEIEPDTKCYLAGFDQSSLSRISLFHIQALPVCQGQYYKIPLLDEEISIASFDFLKNHIYKDNEYFDEKALILDATKTDNNRKTRTVEAAAGDPENSIVGKLKDIKNRSKVSESMEVDLHIGALREDYSRLSNTEILRIQMNHFRSALEDAISNKVRRIVFIHGVGNGTLKLELRNELKRSYPEFSYQDASFKEYGFGATMVHLR